MKKLIITLAITLLAGANIMAADYFWVGGSGNWSDYANHWATSTGGATFHTQAPTENDNVYFDANSFAASDQLVTIDVDAYCADMNWTGATNEPGLAGATTRKLNIYGSLTFIETMNFSFSGEVYFESTLTGKTITSAGQIFKRHVYFQGEGGYILQDAFEQTGGYDVYFIRGSLNFNNQLFNARRFMSTIGNVRVLNLGSSTITLSYSGTANAFEINGTNLTFDAGTSLIKLTGTTARFKNSNSGLIFYNLLSESETGTTIISSSNTVFNFVTISNNGTLSGVNTIDTLLINGDATIGTDNNNITTLEVGGTATINDDNGNYGYVTMNGNGNINGYDNTFGTLIFTAGNLYKFQSARTQFITDNFFANGTETETIIIEASSAGSQATINKASGNSVIVNYVLLKDNKAAGGVTFTANNSIDMGNNEGWTIIAPSSRDLYWVGGTGDWNDPTNWAEESNGTGGGGIPSLLDNTFFDAFSFDATGQTVTVIGNATNDAYCMNMDWTGVTNNPTINSSTSVKLNIHGSLTMVNGMAWNFSGDVYFLGEDASKTSYTITSASQTFKRNMYFQGTGNYTLQDDFEISGSNILYFENGGLDLNNNDFTGYRFLSTNSNIRSLSLGSSIITFSYSGTADVLSINGTNLTFNAGSSLIKLIGATSRFRNSGTGLTFHNLLCESETGTTVIYASNTEFNIVTISNSGTLTGVNTIDSLTINGNATIGADNNNITTLEVGGTATINNDNGNYGHVTLNGNGNINGYDNTYGTLIFTAGHLYKFQSARTQFITGDFIANGTETEQIVVEASSSGSQATISKASGNNVVVEYVTLKDNKAIGGVSFTANNSIDMGNNEGWIINAPGGRDLYWVGGTGDWNDVSNWATESNGLGGAGIPSQLDNVFFDAFSFDASGQTVTVIGDVTNDAYCMNMDWTGVTNNPTITSSTSVKLNIHGSLTMVNGMAWNFSGDVYLLGEDASKTSYTITSASQTFKRNVYFQGTGDYTLQDDFEISGGNILYFENGGLDLNNNDFTGYRFLSTNSNFRSLSLGSSIITLSYSGTADVLSINGTNLTFNAGTSLIKLTGTGPRFRNSGTGLSFYNVLFESETGTSYIVSSSTTFNNVTINNSAILSGGNTINLLTINGNATIGTNNNNITTLVVGGSTTINNDNGNYGHVTMNGNGNINGYDNTFGTLIFAAGNLYKFQSARTQFITDDFFANGTETEPIVIEASSSGSQATISKAIGNNVVVEYVSLKDNKAIGGVSFTANNSLDMGNNEGWTINAPGGRDLYWVGGTGDWNDVGNWATESNGTGGAGIPSLLDNVFFDAFSFDAIGQTVTVIGDATNDAYCMNMDWTGVTNNPTITSSISVKLNIHGSLTMVNGMAWNFSGDVYFLGEDASKTSYTITSASQTFKRNVYFQGTGDYTLQDDLEISGSNILYFENGGLDLNNNDFTGYRFLSDNSNTRSLNLTSSVITLSYSGTAYTLDIDGTNLTFNAGTSLLKYTGSYPKMRNSGTGLTFYNALFESETGTSHIVSSSTIFNVVTINNDGNLSGGNTISSLIINGDATIGTDNNNITTLVIGGTTVINNNGFYGHVTLNGDGNITGSNTFGTLIFTVGNNYTLTNGKTQEILTELVAEGTCAEPITIQSNSTTLHTTINKTSGTVNVIRAILQGINATGDATFIAENSVDAGNNTGWDFIVFPENLYWVGGNGNWDDVNKWSNQSGGAGGYCLPSRIDNVIFDANSFFQEAQYIDINAQNAECRDMDWTGVQFAPTVIGATTNNLQIFGSLTFSTEMNFNFPGKVYFEGKGETKSTYTIFSGGQSFNNHIYFNGVGGEWTFQDNLNAGASNIYLEHGTLNTNDNSVSCGRFISTNSNARALNMGASKFNLSSTSNEAWYVTSSNLSFDAGNSEIIFISAGGGLRSDGASVLNYDKILFLNVGGTSVLRSSHQFIDVVFNPVGTIREGGSFGNVTMHRGGQLQNNSTYDGTVKLNGNTTFTGTNNFRRLLLGAGNEFTFPAGLTQTISGRFIIWGNAANPVTIQSSVSGTRSIISKSNGTVLGNYIQLKDMEATGGATFDLYSSVDNGNNVGWNFLAGTYDELVGITISNAQTECYEATEVITVGGTNHFIVQNGGNATLIAGYKIELLPGTRVFSGGHLQAFITPYGFFCDTISTMLASDLVGQLAEEQFPSMIKKDFFFHIFPNPTTGKFTLELKEFNESSAIVIEINSIVGERIIRQELPAASQYQVDLSPYQPGIYLVRVIQGKEAGVLKVAKQ
ncbi:MAG: hypothetical protein IH597_04850 [Bacteroidales bacterium]|nr:hypothetical protein [Bacteroidales bacterium]